MTANPLRAARGTTATLATRALKDGELAKNTDTERLHIGDDTTLGGLPIALLSDVTAAASADDVRLDALEALTTNLGGTPISAAMAPVVQAASLALGRTAFALGAASDVTFGTLAIGDSAAIDTDAPGALGLNVAKTSTATATTPYQFGAEVFLGIAPATNSSCIFRGLYVRSETLTDVDVSEAIGISGYQYHSGDGTLATQYGGTMQTRLYGAGNVTSGQGCLCAARVGVGATGKYGFGRGATASAISDRADGGVAFDTGVGLQAQARITANSSMTAAYAVDAEVLLEASGAAMTTAHAGYFHGTLAASSSITTLYGVRVALSNSGAVTNYYGIYIGAPTGNAPTTNHFAFYSASTAWSYSAGNWGLRHDTPSEATLVIEQDSNAAALYTLRTSDDAAGVAWTVDVNSQSPAANDVLYTLTIQGRDSGGNATNYASQTATLIDPTDGSEDARWSWQTIIGGTSATRFRLGAGLYAFGTNDQGAGSINAAAGFFMNDTAVITTSRGHKLRAYAATAIADKTNAVNTTDKSSGVTVWDSTNNRVMVASGSTDVAPWYRADGAASVTPA